MIKQTLLIGTILISITISSASALSLRFVEEGDISPLSKIVSSLFATGKTGAALVGDISDIATTTFILTTKQKSYVIAYTSETKVRKLGFPAKLSDMKEGDKVSVVSAVVKPEQKYDQAKLRAKIVSILSQEGEVKSDKKDKEKDKENDMATSTDIQGGEGENKESIGEKERKSEKENERIEKLEKKETASSDQSRR